MKATKIAVKYQKEFEEDIFIEMHCYRRRGHNELDDPTFTNPEIYRTIYETPTLPKKYCDKLQKNGVISTEQVSYMFVFGILI